MKIKSLRKQIKKILDYNGVEVSEEEFDKNFDSYTKNYSRFKLVDGNKIQFLKKEQ